MKQRAMRAEVLPVPPSGRFEQRSDLAGYLEADGAECLQASNNRPTAKLVISFLVSIGWVFNLDHALPV